MLAPGPHQRRERRGQRLQRERAGLERRRSRSPPARSGSRPPSASSGANAIACSDAVDTAPALAQRRRHRVQVLGLVDVELEHVGRLRAAAGPRARSAAARARSSSARSRRPPPAPARAAWNAIESLVMHAGDQQPLAVEDHDGVTGARRAARGQRPRARQPAARACRAGSIDLVDEAGRGGGLGAQVLVGVRVGEARRARPRGPRRHASSRRLMIPTAGARAHDPELGLGPGEHEVGAEVARVHRDVRAAVGLAQDHGQLRHRALPRTRARATRRGGSRRPAPAWCRA